MRGQYDQKFIPLRGFLTCVFLLMVFSLLLGVSLCSSLDEFLDNGNHEHKHKQKHGHHKHHGHGHHNAHQPKKGIDYFLHHESHLTEYDWNSFAPANPKPKEEMTPIGRGRPVADLHLHQPVYVSLTTTSSRIRSVAATITDILKGSVIPTHIFLFVSNDKFLEDKGVQKSVLPQSLQDLAANQPFTIVFTKNIGPHRRLLPLLSKFWKTDCVIIAIDDDRSSEYNQRVVEKLLSYYIHSGKSAIVALKARRIGLCAGLEQVSAFDACSWPVISNERTEMLAIPDGTGGVLYRPRFFHELIFDPALNEITKYNDDIAYRLATLVKGTPVFMGNSAYPDPPECTPEAEKLSIASVKSKNEAINRRSLEAIAIGGSRVQIDLLTGQTAQVTIADRAAAPGDTSSWAPNKAKNSFMWTDGLNYVESSGGYMNFTEIVLNHANKERKECLFRNKQNSYALNDENLLLHCGFKPGKICDDVRNYHFESV